MNASFEFFTRGKNIKKNSTRCWGRTNYAPASNFRKPNRNHDDRVDNESANIVLCVPDDDSQKVAESMIGKVERTALIIDDVNLEEIFEHYCNGCETFLTYVIAT
ncbi:hypothetical protein F8M41_013304 [Gigaspora margarita]|uniref:Uncharacterized protein n=1 Tax=Gigaspora margarita TaxID=4874 RepID=A0A8H4B3V8_GIGMA|nr:hypothetical protein F8M41_013304 [Gigaspora margarita]